MKLSALPKKVRKLKALPQGGKIGIWAPSSTLAPEKLKAGIREIEKRGYSVSIPEDPSLNFGKSDPTFSSASVSVRLSALYRLLRDETVDAIICARGGYGALELLPKIDWEVFSKHPKPIVGVSDITALLLPLTARSGVPTIHGPVLASGFSRVEESSDARWSVGALLQLLSDADEAIVIHKLDELRKGSGEGRVIGGNLSMLLALQGTPWDISYDGAILLIEDVNEPPYRVRRLLAQLKLAGKLDRLSGLVFGTFTPPSAANSVLHNPASIEDVIQSAVGDLLAGTTYPVLQGFPFGHAELNQAVAIGCMADISAGELTFLESPVE